MASSIAAGLGFIFADKQINKLETGAEWEMASCELVFRLWQALEYKVVSPFLLLPRLLTVYSYAQLLRITYC